MHKLLVMTVSGLISLGLLGFDPFGPAEGFDDPPPPPKKKGDPAKKGESGPAGDLRRAYDLLRRVKTDDGATGRSDERLRDWTDRASKMYRKGIAAEAAGDHREAHEYGVAAHDLARAVDHARNASKFDRPDPDLPPPPEGPGPEGDMARTRRDLRHAYDRIEEADDDEPEAKFYLEAARDLYNAARRDAENNRPERAGELARASEALTHVPEHLGLAEEASKPGEPKPKPKRDRRKAKKGDHPAPPKAKQGERPDDDELPPPLLPRS